MADREIESNRIVGIERAQGAGDVGRHLPPGARVPRKAQAVPEADHVGVERHDQFGGRHARPHPEVDFIGAHHPAEKQIQALAGAAGRRTRKKIADTRALWDTTVGATDVEGERTGRKTVECGSDVFVLGRQPLDEEALDAAVPLEHLAQDPEQGGDIHSADPPMHHLPKLRMRRRGIELTHKHRWMRSHDA